MSYFPLTNNLTEMPDTEVIPGATYHLIPFIGVYSSLKL